MVWNARQKQKDVLARILNLNSAITTGKDPSELYKVLVLDRYTKDIIAPLLRVNDLRRHGVTLHLMLEADRQPIPDVPAVYLVQPTAANIERLIADAAAGLYESMHLNFTTSLPSKLLEQLATGVVKADATQRVAKLYDQYVSFIALEPSMFSLGLPDAYVQLNNPAAQDTHIEAVVASIVDGLFSLCVTLGVVPVIRCPRGGVAEHVAGLLDSKLRDALRARNNLFTEGTTGLTASLSRPLLVLLDRNFDMSASLTHPWTYKPLVQDVLGLHLNRVSVQGEAGPGKGDGKRSYDVDDSDFFWEACGAHAFPKMAEEVETQLQRYRAAVDEVNKHTIAGAQEGVYVDAEELMRKHTQHIMSAVSSLPELQEQKKTLDKHMNMASMLLTSIKGRSLDEWHSTGEDLLAGKADLAAVNKLVGGMKGSHADRLRLAIIWLVTYEGMPSDNEYKEVESGLKAAGCDTTALAYVRSLKRNNLVGVKPGQDGGAAAAAAQSGTALFDYVTKSVKTLLSGARQAPVTCALEALMEGKQGSVEHESFAVFDPKGPAGRVGIERAKGPFRDAIVFLIGGGNYMEREAISSWASRSSAASAPGASVLGSGAGGGAPRHVLYGTTELLTGDQFVSQLAELGRLSGLGPGKLAVEAAPPVAPAK